MSTVTKFSLANKGQRITATAASVFTQFSVGAQRQMAAVSRDCMIANPGTVGVFVISGVDTAAPTADNTCVYIPPGTSRTFRKPESHNGLALLSAGANQDIVVYHGNGE